MMKHLRISKSRSLTRGCLFTLPALLIAALLYKSEFTSSMYTHDNTSHQQFNYVGKAARDTTVNGGPNGADIGKTSADESGILQLETVEEVHLTTIRSPLAPDSRQGEDVQAVDEVRNDHKNPSSKVLPPPFPKAFRPPPETRPFNEFQEDPLENVLGELEKCSTLRCIIRVHDKIDGRTAFNLPHFFIAGWPHTGVEYIINHLNRHSEFDGTVRLNGSSWFNHCQTEKGPNVDDPDCNSRSEWDYIQNFLNAKRAAETKLEMITVDTSTDYVQAGGPLARRLYRYFPWLKVVIIIRDPLTRLVTKVRRPGTDELNPSFEGCTRNKQLFSCLTDVMAPGTIDSNYSEPLLDWVQTFPREQLHVIQFEELQQAPDKVIFDLKYFLGANVAELDGQFSMGKVKKVVTPVRRGQYLRLVRNIQDDMERTLSILHQYGLAPKKSWMSRWESKWQQVLSNCNHEDVCYIETLEDASDSKEQKDQ